jgi:hypothetical protein
MNNLRCNSSCGTPKQGARTRGRAGTEENDAMDLTGGSPLDVTVTAGSGPSGTPKRRISPWVKPARVVGGTRRSARLSNVRSKRAWSELFTQPTESPSGTPSVDPQEKAPEPQESQEEVAATPLSQCQSPMATGNGNQEPLEDDEASVSTAAMLMELRRGGSDDGCPVPVPQEKWQKFLEIVTPELVERTLNAAAAKGVDKSAAEENFPEEVWSKLPQYARAEVMRKYRLPPAVLSGFDAGQLEQYHKGKQDNFGKAGMEWLQKIGQEGLKKELNVRQKLQRLGRPIGHAPGTNNQCLLESLLRLFSQEGGLDNKQVVERSLYARFRSLVLKYISHPTCRMSFSVDSSNGDKARLVSGSQYAAYMSDDGDKACSHPWAASDMVAINELLVAVFGEQGRIGVFKAEHNPAGPPKPIYQGCTGGGMFGDVYLEASHFSPVPSSRKVGESFTIEGCVELLEEYVNRLESNRDGEGEKYRVDVLRMAFQHVLVRSAGAQRGNTMAARLLPKMKLTSKSKPPKVSPEDLRAVQVLSPGDTEDDWKAFVQEAFEEARLEAQSVQSLEDVVALLGVFLARWREDDVRRQKEAPQRRVPLGAYWTFAQLVAKLPSEFHVVAADGSLVVPEGQLQAAPEFATTPLCTVWDQMEALRSWCLANGAASQQKAEESKHKENKKRKRKKKKKVVTPVSAAQAGNAAVGAQQEAPQAQQRVSVQQQAKHAPPPKAAARVRQPRGSGQSRSAVCKFWQSGRPCRFMQRVGGCRFLHRFADGVCPSGMRHKCKREVCSHAHTDDNALLCNSWMRTGSCTNKLQCTKAHMVPQPHHQAPQAPAPVAAVAEEDAGWHTVSYRGRGGYRGRGRGRAGLRH